MLHVFFVHVSESGLTGSVEATNVTIYVMEGVHSGLTIFLAQMLYFKENKGTYENMKNLM